MIAVPCSPIVPETDPVAGPSAAGESAARGSRRPSPVVQTYIASQWPRSTTLVSPETISTPAAAAAGRSPRPRRAARRRPAPPRGQRERQRKRPGARHREVVNGAVHGQLADRAAGEADRLDDEASRSSSRASTPSTRLLPRRRARRARPPEGRHEQPLDQRLRCLAAGAVRHGDLLGLEAWALRRAVSMISSTRSSDRERAGAAASGGFTPPPRSRAKRP